MKWPIREGCLCYLAKMRRQALEAYKNELLVWATLAPHQDKKTRSDPPKFPKICKV